MDHQTHCNPDPELVANPPESSTRSPISGVYSALLHRLRNNLVLRSKWWSELNGAMGDLGTYIPIVLALTLAKDLNLGTTLIFTGVYNVITGAVYGVPMPVQPMKAIAAVAITSKAADGSDFGVPEIMSAGICTAAVLLVLGVTGLMALAYRLIPLPVVRGVQLSQGLSFALTAIKYVRKVQDFSKSKSSGDRPWFGLDGLVLALFCGCFIILVNGSGKEIYDDEEVEEELEEGGGSLGQGRGRRLKKFIIEVPSAFIIFLLGVALAIIRGPEMFKGIELGPSPMAAVKISKKAWREGFIKGTVPQLPLSILNSVIAVCKLSSDLFPGQEFSATSVSVSVGLMNLVGCWFGAMPCCHGAGGLAGQYKFGGRSGGCVALLGAAKLGLGLLFGSSLVRVLGQFPVGVLGVLLLFSGIELALACRDMGSKEESFVMLLCAAVSLVGSSAALGFVSGVLVYLLLWLRKKMLS